MTTSEPDILFIQLNTIMLLCPVRVRGGKEGWGWGGEMRQKG